MRLRATKRIFSFGKVEVVKPFEEWQEMKQESPAGSIYFVKFKPCFKLKLKTSIVQ